MTETPPRSKPHLPGKPIPGDLEEDGTRIRIRGPRKADVPVLADLMAGPNVVQGLSVMPFIGEYEVERMLQHSECRYWLVAEQDGVPAGWAFLEWGSGRWRRIASVGIGIGDAKAGLGLGRRLMTSLLWVGFGYLDMHKIELVVYIDNLAAIRLYETLGFVNEGTKRGNAIRDGSFVDAHVMSLLQPDWLAGLDEPVRQSVRARQARATHDEAKQVGATLSGC